MRKVWFITAVMVASFFVTALPVAAGPGDAPEESGAVTRFTEPGLQVLFDADSTLDGEGTPLVAIYNLASPEDFCSFELAGGGEIQVVSTPSGRDNVVLHDDVPVLVYDVTDVPGGPNFFSDFLEAACDPDDPLEPIATGQARVRNNVQIDRDAGTFRQHFKATGDVTDGGTTWSLSSQRHVEGELGNPPPPDELGDRITMARRGG